MISHLRGGVHKLDPGEVSVDVAGVGYRVLVPLDVWDELKEGETRMLWISLYVREDRLELYGFLNRNGRELFEELLKISGIGPRMAVEILSVPRSMLMHAVSQEDAKILSGIRGVGKKTAEKLLLELRSLQERKPMIFGDTKDLPARAEYDNDAIAALTALGYDTSTAMRALKDIPAELKSTEERVSAALRSL